MSGWPLKRIVIAGGGTAGWMAAAAIARTLGRAVDLTLVESDAIGTIGVGESTIPPLVTYNRLLGINEAEFMRATQATFKLGIQFDNWREAGKSYFHSFGLTGKDHWSAGFQHFWLAARERGLASSYGDYCLELKAAAARASSRTCPTTGWTMPTSSMPRFTLKFLRRDGRRRRRRPASRARSPRSSSMAKAATSPRSCWKAASGSRATCSSTAPAFARC